MTPFDPYPLILTLAVNHNLSLTSRDPTCQSLVFDLAPPPADQTPTLPVHLPTADAAATARTSPPLPVPVDSSSLMCTVHRRPTRRRRRPDESYFYATLLGAAAVDSAAGCLLIAVNHSSLMSPPSTDSAAWAAVCLKLINRCILSYWRHSDNARLTHDGSFTHSSLSS